MQSSDNKKALIPSTSGTRGRSLLPVVPPSLPFRLAPREMLRRSQLPLLQHCNEDEKTTHLRLLCCMGAVHLRLLACQVFYIHRQTVYSLRQAFFGQPLTKAF